MKKLPPQLASGKTVQFTDVNWKRDLQIPRLFHYPNDHMGGEIIRQDGMKQNSIAVRIRCRVGDISLDNVAIGISWSQ